MATSKLPPTAQAYLKEALQRWDDIQRLPDDETLHALAIQSELTPEASQACDDLAVQLTEEARSILKSPDPGAAEDTLRRAILLAPLRLEPCYLLAQLYADRYRGHRDPEDHARAEELAKRCRYLDSSHKDTKKLLDELSDIPGRGGLSWRQAALITFLLVMISGGISTCVRYTLAPDIPEESVEEVRQYLEDQLPPP